MGGFAALIGGLGGAAQQYGNQVRGFLENRRVGIANQLLQEAGRTWDPEHRSNLLQGVTDLMSNVPMDKAMGPVLKSYQTHEQGTQWHAQLGQAVQQAMPQPGPPQPGPPAVGQQPGTTLPADITAALPPLSPVSPEAQGGGPGPAPFAQGLAPNSPLAPAPQEAPPLTAAIGQPAAAPPGGPTTPQAMPQALGQSFDPLEYTQRAYEYLRGLPPGAREGLAPDVLQGAEANRQLGIAYVQMGWRRQQAEPAIAEMDKVLNNPDSSIFERMAARSAKIQAQEWIAGGGAAPAFPLTASNLIQLNRGRIQSVDVTNMPPDVKAFYGIPESAVGAQLMSTDPMSNQIREGGWVGQASPQMRPQTVWDNATKSFQQMAVDVGHPGEGPLGFGNQGGRYQFLPPGWGSPLLQTDIQGRDFIAPKQPGYTGGVATSVIPRWATEWRTVKEMTPSGPVDRLEPVPVYRGAGSFGAGAPGPVPQLTPPATMGAPQTTPAAPTGAPPSGPFKAGPAGPLGLPGLQPREYPQTLPNQLTQAGQNNVKVIDAVLGQIDRAQELMKKYGLDKQNNRNYWDDYLHYKNSGESKYEGLYTVLNFERLRSASTAMQGTGRAIQIYQEAMQHTPALEPDIGPILHLQMPKFEPDTGVGITNKLNEMKQMMLDARKANLQDEKKSGLVSPEYTPAGTTAPPPTATGGTAPLSIKLSSGKTIEIH